MDDINGTIMQNSMTDDDIFMVGYGGWVKVMREQQGTPYHDFRTDDHEYTGEMAMDLATVGRMLQVTSASVTRQTNIPSVNSYYLPYDDIEGTARSQILLGGGTYTFTGQLSFELSFGALTEFLCEDFFERDSLFTLSFFDGQKTCVVANCVWSSIAIQCQPNSLVSMSLSFGSNNGYMDDLQVFEGDGHIGIMYDESDLLIPYWQCGHGGFQEFSLSFERSVTPVFLNGDLNVAAYLRPGLVTVSLSATTIEYIEDWEEALRIVIGGKVAVTLLKSILQSKQYNMSSMSDTGAKTYTWTSIADTPKERVFMIEDMEHHSTSV